MTGIEIVRRGPYSIKALASSKEGGAAISRDLFSRESLRAMVGVGAVHEFGGDPGRGWEPVVTVGIRW